MPVPPLAIESVPVVPAMIGSPVPLVRVTDDGVPRLGLIKVGESLKTASPVPVSSFKTPLSCALVVAANCASVAVVTPHVGQLIESAATLKGETTPISRVTAPVVPPPVRPAPAVTPVMVPPL